MRHIYEVGSRTDDACVSYLKYYVLNITSLNITNHKTVLELRIVTFPMNFALLSFPMSPNSSVMSSCVTDSCRLLTCEKQHDY